MPLQYFVLDSLHADCAAVRTALTTATAAKYSYTPTQVLRDAPHDATVKLVAANVEEAELVGALAPLAPANYGAGVYLDGYPDLQDLRERGFLLLQESIRSAYGENGRNGWYVRPEGEVIGGDGRTYGTAWNGPQDTNIGAADESFLAGDTYWLCGVQAFSTTALQFGVAELIKLDDPGGGRATEIRGDLRRRPGLMCGGYRYAVDDAPWVKDGTSNMYSQADAIQRSVSTVGWTLKPADPTMTFAALEDFVLAPVASIAECQSTPGTIHIPDTAGSTADPKIAYVHAPDGSDPTDRLLYEKFGYDFDIKGSPQKGPYRFVHMTFFEARERFAGWGGGTASGVNTAPDSVDFAGCRFIVPGSMKISEKMTRWRLGSSRDLAAPGVVPFSTAGEPDAGDSRIVKLLAEKPAIPASKFDDMARWCHVAHSDSGPYAFSVGTTNILSEFVIDGIKIRRIGQADWKGFDFSDNDMHAVGAQGVSGASIQRFMIYDEGGASLINFYAKAGGGAPGGTAQNLENNYIAYGVLDGVNQNHAASIAGFNGINFNGDNDCIPMTDGTGLRGGNVTEYVYIKDIVGDPNLLTSGVQASGSGFSANVEQLNTLRHSIIENCRIGIIGSRNFTDTNGKNWGSWTKVHDCIFIRGADSVLEWWERSGGWQGGSGVIDADNNEIRLQAGEDAATDLFRIQGTQLTLTAAQALSKTNGGPAADQPSTFWTDTTLTPAL